MREHGKKKEGQRNVIPPQIFNGQEFRGVRCGHFYDQLKLVFQGLRRLWYRQWRWCPWRVPRSGKVKTKGTAIKMRKRGIQSMQRDMKIWKSLLLQIAPVKTGAVAPEVNKLNVGKLDLKEEAKSSKEKDEVFDVTFIPSLYFFLSVHFLLSSFLFSLLCS